MAIFCNRNDFLMRLEIIHGSVTKMPFEDSVLDVVTALETVQFWPEADKSFSKVNQLLKNSGFFLILNRYPTEGSKWWQMANSKNDKNYLNKLENAGFSQVIIDLVFKKGWIIVKAIK